MFQASLHFMDRLSKTVRRPLAQLSPNVQTQKTAATAATRPLAPSTVYLKPKTAAQSGKARSLVPPKGLFRPLESKVNPQEKPLDSADRPTSAVFQPVKTKAAPAKPNPVGPPTGVARPAEKVAPKKVCRYQNNSSGL